MSKKKSIGLGDTLDKFTEVTGIKKAIEIFVDGKDCGCEKRKDKLNELFPYKFKARCFTEDEYNNWRQFKETRTLKITKEQSIFVSEFYGSIFNRVPYVVDESSSMKPLIDMIDKLDRVYETYNY